MDNNYRIIKENLKIGDALYRIEQRIPHAIEFLGLTLWRFDKWERVLMLGDNERFFKTPYYEEAKSNLERLEKDRIRRKGQEIDTEEVVS